MIIMREHLWLISKRTQAERYAVIIDDGAAWQWLRQNELANMCFEGYEDIVENCSRAWNRLVSDSKRVASLCSREWIEVGD
jgi:hypothetical protein